MKIHTIVFDLGNVLVDWSPSYLFDKLFTDGKKQAYFLQNICSEEWHAAQDRGRPVHEATEMLVKEHPDWEHPIRAFYARWKEMFQGAIEGSVQILKELKDKGYKLYALTNWSAELFNDSLKDFPFLAWFDGILVSGEVKMAKPDRNIYQVLIDRYQLDPQKTVFIDDKEKNVAAARDLGMMGIRFEHPEGLRAVLASMNVL